MNSLQLEGYIGDLGQRQRKGREADLGGKWGMVLTRMKELGKCQIRVGFY